MHFLLCYIFQTGKNILLFCVVVLFFFAFQLYRLVIFDIFMAFLFMVGSGAGL